MRFALFACLISCGGKSSPAPTPTGSGSGAPVASGECIKTGCSGTICAEPGNDVMSTCEMKAEYACYQSATCARQGDGACGWTQTPELAGCLANPPKL